MKTPNTALVSPAEKSKLLELGKELKKLDNDRNSLLTKARAIIGFASAEATIGIDEALNDAWCQCEDKKKIFVEYAEMSRAEWRLADAVEEIKVLLGKMDRTPKDIVWDQTDE